MKSHLEWRCSKKNATFILLFRTIKLPHLTKHIVQTLCNLCRCLGLFLVFALSQSSVFCVSSLYLHFPCPLLVSVWNDVTLPVCKLRFGPEISTFYAGSLGLVMLLQEEIIRQSVIPGPGGRVCACMEPATPMHWKCL